MNNIDKDPKIGVFLYHCGDNIADTVKIKELKKEFSKNKELVVKDHLFVRSEAGQNLILKTLTDGNIDRVVVASCSPKHHWNISKSCI